MGVTYKDYIKSLRDKQKEEREEKTESNTTPSSVYSKLYEANRKKREKEETDRQTERERQSFVATRKAARAKINAQNEDFASAKPRNEIDLVKGIVDDYTRTVDRENLERSAYLERYGYKDAVNVHDIFTDPKFSTVSKLERFELLNDKNKRRNAYREDATDYAAQTLKSANDTNARMRKNVADIDKNAEAIDKYYGAGTAEKMKQDLGIVAQSAWERSSGANKSKEYSQVIDAYGGEEKFRRAVEKETIGWNAGKEDPEGVEKRQARAKWDEDRIAEIDQEINNLDRATYDPTYSGYAENDSLDGIEEKKKALIEERDELQADLAEYNVLQKKIDDGDRVAIAASKLSGEDPDDRYVQYVELSAELQRIKSLIDSGKETTTNVTQNGQVYKSTGDAYSDEEYITLDGEHTGMTYQEALEYYQAQLLQYERSLAPTDRYTSLLADYDNIVNSEEYNATKAMKNDVDRFLKLQKKGERADYNPGIDPNITGDMGYGGGYWEMSNPDTHGEDASLLTRGKTFYWDRFTEDELKIIRALWGTGRKDEAYQFISDMSPILGKRDLQASEEWLEKEASTLDKVFASVAGVAQRTVGGIPAFAEDVAMTAAGMDTNPYSYLHQAQNQGQAIEAQVAQDINEAMPNLNFFGLSAGQVYQGIQSGIDSGVSRALFGKGSVVAMAMGAASSEAKELWEKGATREQIAVGSSIAGIAEALFEYVSLEMAFKNFMESTPTSKMDFIKKALIQMGVEGSEEVFTDIANLMGDAFNMNTQSEWAQYIKKYTDQGYSEAEAFGMAMWNDVISGKLWESFLGGALGTVFSTGGNFVQSLTGTYATGANIQRNGTSDQLMEYANEVAQQSPRSTVQESLEKAQANPSKMNLGFLAMAVNQQTVKQSEADINQALKENGIDSKTAKKVKNAFMSMVNDPEYELTDEEQQLLEDERVLNAYNQVFGEEGTVTERNNAYQEAMTPSQEDTVTPESVRDLLGPAGQAEFDEAVSKGYDSTDFVKAYLDGRMGTGAVTAQETLPAVNASNSTDTMTRLAYNAGRADAIGNNALNAVQNAVKAITPSQSQAKRGEALAEGAKKLVGTSTKGMYGRTVVSSNPGLIQDKAYKKAGVSRDQARLTNSIANALKIQVRFDENLTNDRGQTLNGHYDQNTATITLSTSVKNPAMAILGHEMVHRIRNVSEEAYDALRDYVIQAMNDDSMKWVLGKRGELYNSKDSDFVTEEAVADAVGVLLGTSKNIQDRLTKEFATKNRNVLQKILDVIRDIAYAVRTKLSGSRKTLTANQIAEFEDLQSNLAAMENAIVTALKEAEERVKVQNEITTDEKSVKSDLKVTEESQNTPVKFSLAHSDEIAETSLKAAREKKDLGFPVSYVRTANAAVKEVADIIKKELAGKKDKNGADLIPEEGELTNNVFDNNSYIKAADPTTECWRQTIYRVMNKNVTDRLGRPLTTKEAIVLNQAAIMIGVDAPCIYCYSLLDRKAKEGYKLQYLAERDGFLNNLYKDFNGDIEEFKRQRSEVFQKYYERYLSRDDDPAAYKNGKYQKSMARKGNQAKMDRVNLWMDVFESLYVDNKMLTANDIRNYETESETRAEYEKISDAKTRDLKLRELDDVIYWAQQASQAKKIIPYSAYGNFGVEDGLLGWSSNLIDKLNSAFGLRWYDHADYHPAFTVDNMQQVIDASIMGLKGLMYCKPTEIAEILAPTGMNINVSCFAQYNEKTGTYEMDDRLGADWNIVQKLRKNHKNVGSVMVVTSDDMLFWALAQDWVDVVIPLHLVRSGSDFVEEFDLNNYTPETEEKIDWKDKYDKYIESLSKNYSAEEFAKKKKGLKESKKTAYPSEHNNDYKTYMGIVNERGLRPKFDRIRQMVENGTAEYQGTKITPDMYMKLVNETRMSAKDTKPLVPKFNVEAAKSAVRSLETKGYYDYFQTSAVNPEDGVAYDVKGWEDIAVRDILAGKTGSQVGYGRDLKTGEDQILSRRAAKKAGVGGRHDAVRESIVSPEENERYLELAKNPEYFVNKIQLEQMVQDAARKAGFDSPKLYSGTNAFGYTRIDTSAPGGDGFSFWASNDENTSATYTKYGKVRRINQEITYDKIDELVDEANEELDDAIYEFRRAIDRTFSEWVFGQTDNSYLEKLVRDANPEPGNGDGVYDALDDIIVRAWYDYKGSDVDDLTEWQESEEGEKVYNTVVEVEALYGKLRELENANPDEMIGGIYELYANTDNMYVLDGKGKTWQNLRSNDFPKLDKPWKKDAPYTTRDVANWARAQGYDGVIFKNIRDFGQYGVSTPADVYAFFNPNAQVKSADPVTYDDNGNVIPLEERFNPENEDIRYSVEQASELYRTENDFREAMPLEQFRDAIKKESAAESYFPKGLSSNFLKAISRKSVFNKTKVYRGMDANEMDYLIENKFLKSNGSYNFQNQQGQTLGDEDPVYALGYATGFAPKEIADRHYKDGQPSYLVEYLNSPDLNIYKNSVQESYTYGDIDQKYITRIFEIEYDQEKKTDMVRDVTEEMRKMLPNMGDALSENAHGEPLFYRDKTTGTILYAVQGEDGWENGRYISQHDADRDSGAPMTFSYDGFKSGALSPFAASLFGISGNESDLVPLKVGQDGTLEGTRESIDYRDTLDEMVKQYGKIPKGENPYRDIELPKRTSESRKVSQTVRTILEAKVTPDTVVPTIEELVSKGEFSFESITDKDALEEAKERITKDGFAPSLASFIKSVERGYVSKITTALGWQLYDAAATAGDTQAALTVLRAMVAHQRAAAQALQATTILKKMSPEAQLYNMQKSLDDIIEEVKKRYGTDKEGYRKQKIDSIQINPLLAEQFLKARSDEERAIIYRQIYADIAQQLPTSFADRWTAWRYLCMLGNVKTHLRNFLGNALFAPIVLTKDAIATGLEAAVSKASKGKLNRTKSLGILTTDKGRQLYAAAWADYANVQELALGERKYNERGFNIREIDEQRKIFGNTRFKPWNVTGGWVLEKWRTVSDKGLEKEDIWFNQPAYAYAMAQYCKAHGITPDQISRGKGLEAARQYGIKEAQKATYRDTNVLSEAMSRLGRRSTKNNPASKAGSMIVEGILPFRKTPANILVRGLEYSPLGLLKSLTYDLGRVKSGEISGAEAIDNISAGLTGTMLTMLGVLLAHFGLVRGHIKKRDKEEDLESAQGHQRYSIEIGGNSYTIDWLAPESIPFFVGVNLYNAMTSGDKGMSMDEIIGVLSNTTEPILGLSCLSGLNDTIESVAYSKQSGENVLISLPASAATSYLMQMFPTLGGQLDKTIEDKRYKTYPDKNQWLSAEVQRAIAQAANKIPIPGVEYAQVPYIDGWGREETTGAWWVRGLNNFLNPAYVQKINESEMDDELLRLSDVIDARDDRSSGTEVMPAQGTNKISVNNQDVYFTPEQYVQYNSARGAAAYETVGNIIASKEYKDLTDDEKISVIKAAYSYSQDVGRTAILMPANDNWTMEALEGEKKYNLPAWEFVLIRNKLNQASGKERSMDMRDIIYSTPGLNSTQRNYLLHCKSFNIGKKARGD